MCRIAEQGRELRAHGLHERAREHACGQEGQGEREQPQPLPSVTQYAAVRGEDAHQCVRAAARDRHESRGAPRREQSGESHRGAETVAFPRAVVEPRDG